VQENDSPTYADPKAGGSVRSGESMKASFLGEGYASEADGVGKAFGESLGEGEGVGRACWTESDGRESLSPRSAGIVLGLGKDIYRRTFKETE
jgi:hypothetical protein